MDYKFTWDSANSENIRMIDTTDDTDDTAELKLLPQN